MRYHKIVNIYIVKTHV